MRRVRPLQYLFSAEGTLHSFIGSAFFAHRIGVVQEKGKEK